ncbi:PLC-like phosphodiesterase [Acaromyces ingoldii]|uniref:PLC-like phosphodiesterase n=1 Tax=Acaromyces ingoldii TaxID=215250 RepID=A0A316YR86_9BASI|nr:PLC-like phosphodiesterase [Acaromyces ingoldii]PWN90285.1 PLC-like phosphodiesterase [Acaromyces ingoldii]
MAPKTMEHVRSTAERRLRPLRLPSARIMGHVNNTSYDAVLESFRLRGVAPDMPECWGHRGASVAFPENTIASFERAIRDGSEGLESDVHITADDVIIMFHDAALGRTTDGKGLIKNQNWDGNIENIRTLKQPFQQIPTFRQACDLLMRPENQHVKFNIDIKPDNQPERLFKLMKEIVESYPDFESKLAPRLILGLWHPIFLDAALKFVPALRRVHIGGSPMAARTYFWNHCDGFSMWFPSLVGADGQAFLQEAREAKKDVFVWTVNRRDEMIEATRWGVKAILTDKTDMFQEVRKDMASDYISTRSEQVGLFFRWASWKYYMFPIFFYQTLWISQIEGRAGISFKDGRSKEDGATRTSPVSILDEKTMPLDDAPAAPPIAPTPISATA